jgi:hypothetical protein
MDYGDTGGFWDHPMGENNTIIPKITVGELTETGEITYDINPKKDSDVTQGDEELLDNINL